MSLTAPASAAASDLRIGDWRVRADSNELERAGSQSHVEPKVMELLVHLAGRAGEVVTRDELLAAVWPGVVVGDEALTQSMNKLRRALGDEAHHPRYIETIAKRGYRLIAPVQGKTGPAEARRRLPGRRAVAFALAMVMALSVASYMMLRHPPGAIVAGTPPTIAVLPLSNLSGEARRDYFTDGVTEDIINSLGRFSAMRVISRASADRFRDKPPDLAAIRRDLGARYVLAGSVRESDGKLRVAVELSDAASGTLLWSEGYEGAGKDLFTIQDEVVRHIVGALEVKVSRLELARAASKPPASLEAYDLVLQARALAAQSDRAANRKARELLSRAVTLAPDYAEGWVVSSNAETLRSIFGWTETPAESLRLAEQHAFRALALDDPGAHSRAHGLLAVIHSIEGRFDRSLEHAERAIKLNPSDSFAHDTRGATLLWLGRFDEAIASLDAASRYNPAVRSAASGFNRALAHYMLGDAEKSIAAADETLQAHPRAGFVHAVRAAALARLGRHEASEAAVRELRRVDPFFRVEDFGTRFVKPEHYQALQSGLRKAGL
jgi:TolB-like protein/DNA-binding winged helix-turn-helix (wHTH) protein/Tfp pilus assembly protein PilF